jgi:hypothetical protein
VNLKRLSDADCTSFPDDHRKTISGFAVFQVNSDHPLEQMSTVSLLMPLLRKSLVLHCQAPILC